LGSVADGVRVLGGATFIDAVQTKTASGTNDGKTGVAVPELQMNLGAEWDTPWLPGLTLLARGIYTSSQFLNAANTQEVPEWTRFDLGARYLIETRGMPITVRANVQNVFDDSYWASTAGSFGGLGLSAPRTFMLSASFDF
jgi:iron complex outermembrane receptor protein